MKVFNFEIYTCNPETGEQGWDIQFPSIFAESKAEAKDILANKLPHFDCIILFNYGCEIKDGSKDALMFAAGLDYYFPTYSEMYN